MRELLEKWALLEPERCKLLYDGVVLIIDEEWIFPYATPYYADMFIQAAAQKAIMARGLRFGLVGNSTGYYSNVDHWAESDFCLNPAEALLTAYLKVLETLNTKPIEA